MRSPRRFAPLSEPVEDLEDLYETAPCGFASLSPNGRIVKVNRTLADWLGWDAGDLRGKLFHEILGFGGKIAFETHLAPLLRMQGHVYEVALDLVRRDDSRIPAIVNAAEKRGQDGRHLFTRITLFKAVDRRTYERTLLEARLRAESESIAEKKNSLLREQFIAVLGHDLRNPIAALEAGITLLQQREALSESGKAIVAQMHGSVGRADALIADLLDFARGRLGGGISIEREQALLGPIFEQVIAEIRSIAADHPIDFAIDIPRPVYCDGARLGQLASNLLSNAVTHGASGRPVDFRAAIDDGRLLLSVTNEGPPIPGPALDSLFQPFFRGQARSSRNGLGLGLFIASEIAKGHGGTLEARSDNGQVCFTFTMPLESPEEDAA